MLCLNVTTGELSSPCQPTDFVYLTLSEVQALGGASPWNLTLVEGSLISAAILGVWALGFAIKSLKQTIQGGSPND